MRTCIILNEKDLEAVKPNGNKVAISVKSDLDVILNDKAAYEVMKGLQNYFEEKNNVAKSADDDGGEDRPADPRP